MKCRYHRKVNILVLGNQGSGKTSLIKFILKDKSKPVPTLGYSYHIINWKKFKVTFYDVGGSEEHKKLWKNYFAEIHGVIYMIDSTSNQKFAEDKLTIINLVSNNYLKGKPFLIFANKKDVTSNSGLTICNLINFPNIATQYSTCIYYDKISCLLPQRVETPQQKILKKLILKKFQLTKPIKIFPEFMSTELESVEGYIMHAPTKFSKNDQVSESYPSIINPFSCSNESMPGCSYASPDFMNQKDKESEQTSYLHNIKMEYYNERVIVGLNWLLEFIKSQFRFIENRIAKDLIQ